MNPPSPITLRDLASAVGVSVGTVSRALKNQPGLSEQTRNEILRKAEELGYDVMRLRAAKPKRVLFMLNRYHASLSENPFYSVVLHGVEEVCREENVSLSLLTLGAGDPIANWIKRHEPDALIAAGFFDDEMLAEFRAADMPLVLVDHFASDLFCVNDDNLRGAWQATTHLIEQGCERIAMICGPESHYSIRLRARGYRKALFDAGRLADPDLEVMLDSTVPDYGTAAAEAMQRLLEGPNRPDGVFAYNDETAMRAIEVCQARGLEIPRDMLFVGYDDISASARFRPSLTTLRVDKEELGRTAARRLILGDYPPGEVLLPVELIVRESSARSS
jgi:DNA-binding LacI/PurR family transcriptional regulator